METTWGFRGRIQYEKKKMSFFKRKKMIYGETHIFKMFFKQKFPNIISFQNANLECFGTHYYDCAMKNLTNENWEPLIW